MNTGIFNMLNIYIYIYIYIYNTIVDNYVNGIGVITYNVELMIYRQRKRS